MFNLVEIVLFSTGYAWYLMCANLLILALMDTFSNFLPFIFQYVAYADGWIRAYNIQTYAVHYTLQREMGVTLSFLLNI